MTKDQAIDEIKRYIYECDDNALSVEAGEMAISALKERPKGEWIFIDGQHVCSKCNLYNGVESDFCPNCGADMRGKAE